MSSEIQYRLIAPTSIEGPAERAGEVKGTGQGFGQQLGQAIEQLDRLQTDADVQADAIAQGGGNLHEVALAFEKADLALRLATKVRNKVVDVYNEIMRMSV